MAELDPTLSCLLYVEEAESLRNPQNKLLDTPDMAVASLKNNCPSLLPTLTDDF